MDYDDIKIKLCSKDAQEFETTYGVVKCCGTITDLVGDTVDPEKKTCEPIPLSNLTGDELRLIIEYCEHYKGNPPEPNTAVSRELDAWETQFISTMDTTKLNALTLSANYMALVPLVHLCCRQVAVLLKGATKEDIIKKFNISRVYTDAECEEARKDPAWIDDPSLPTY